MKSWFPFSEYDFYAYLTAGLLVLFSIDYGVNDGAIMLREKWPFIQIVFTISVAYLIGHVVAAISSIVFEHWLVHRILRSPTAVMADVGKSTAFQKFIGRWIVGRYYEPLPSSIRKKIISTVADHLEIKHDEIDNPEEIFQSAFPIARSNSDAAARMDTFRNLYGFARNSAFALLISAGALLYRAAAKDEYSLYWWSGMTVLLSIVLFGRYLKFYSAFAAEMLRTYASQIKG